MISQQARVLAAVFVVVVLSVLLVAVLLVTIMRSGPASHAAPQGNGCTVETAAECYAAVHHGCCATSVAEPLP